MLRGVAGVAAAECVALRRVVDYRGYCERAAVALEAEGRRRIAGEQHDWAAQYALQRDLMLAEMAQRAAVTETAHWARFWAGASTPMPRGRASVDIDAALEDVARRRLGELLTRYAAGCSHCCDTLLCDAVPRPFVVTRCEVVRPAAAVWRAYEMGRRHARAARDALALDFLALADAARVAAAVPAELRLGDGEYLLFHGTSTASAASIAENGFDPARASWICPYGAGTYFTPDPCKADQYTGGPLWGGCGDMLVAHVAIGVPSVVRGSYTGDSPPEGTDSVVALPGVANFGMQHHPEFVVFDPAAACPVLRLRYHRPPVA